MSTTGTTLGFGALFPVILVIGLVVVFGRSRRRGRVITATGLVAVVLLFAAMALFHVRATVRNDFVSTGMNTYPGAPGQTLHPTFSSEYTQAAHEARRAVAEVRESVNQVRQRVDSVRLSATVGNGVHESLAEVRPIDVVPLNPWKSVADLGFEADVHPAAALAAESLVVQVLKAKDASHPGISFKRVQIWGGENIGGEVLSRVVARLQREHPDWEVMPEAAEPAEPLARTDERAAAIQMELVSRTMTRRAPWDTNRVQQGGILRLRLSWRGGSLDRSTQFVEKPWVENASEFVSEKPQMRWVIGYSSQDATDIMQATGQAVESAAIQILPVARARIAQSGNVGVDDRWLLDRIQQGLLQMTDVRDRFTQTLITPYGGHVVRQAILVQSPASVQRVVSDGQVHVRWVRSTWFATVASGAGMCVLICVVGLLLNSITKGYYRGRIAVLAGLLLVVGLLAMIKLSGIVFVPHPVASATHSPVTAEYGYVQE